MPQLADKKGQPEAPPETEAWGTTAGVLVVDDEPAIRDLLLEGLKDSGFECSVAANGSEALEALRRRCFALVLSDIDMPGMDGVRLLQRVKEAHPDVEVVMITGVVDVEVALRAMRMGANDYLTKPFNLEEVRLTVERALEKRRLVLENREYQRDLEAKVAERTVEVVLKRREVEELYEKLQISYETTLEALAAALDTRDTETQGHSVRVSEYTVVIARRMGVEEPELTEIRRGALLHDVGKIGIPDAVLRKPGKLTAEEWREMKQHPEIGGRILSGIKFLEKSLPIVMAHQERFDGSGYPQGLKGEEIPLGARIFAVVDTLDAMTSDRPYRKALRYEDAREEIVRNSGIQFDPKVVEVFLSIPPEEWKAMHRRNPDRRPAGF
ncbi:MAG TPA: HD domain-containing phosphohydrolase [Candidatus Polarisedimenticolia bacterium]|nr:HD domain-containing phosphohydrolase [Candidatus Polarisedimenticolia bacterium]